MKVESRTITNRAEWLSWRRQDVTASDIGALCGISDYKSPLQVYHEKKGTVTGEIPDNAFLRRGRMLEPSVLAEVKKANPEFFNLRQPEVYLRAPEHRLGCTPDATAWVDRSISIAVQLKTVEKRVFDEHWTDGPPFAYQLQTLTEGMLHNADRCLLAILIIGSWKYEQYWIERNAVAEQRILDTVAEFWQDLALGVEPETDMELDGKLIRTLYSANAAGATVDLTTKNNRIGELIQTVEDGALMEQAGRLAKDKAKTELVKIHGEHGARYIWWNGYKTNYFPVTMKEHIVREHVQNRLLITKPKGAKW